MQLTHRTWIPAALALGAFAIGPLANVAQAQTPSQAQAETRPGKARPRFTPEQKLEHIKVMRGKMLREEVGLDEKKAAEVENALAAFDADHVKFHQAKRDANMELHTLAKDPNANDKAYRAAVTKYRAAFKQLHNLKEREWNRVSTMLTPKQQALLLLSLGKMKHHFGKKCGHASMCNHKGSCDCPCPACDGPRMCAGGVCQGAGAPITKPAPGKPKVTPVVPPVRQKPTKGVGPGAGVGPVTGPGPAATK